ncbi:putative LOC100569746 [Trichonephila clavipes]|nr:putative LOC100569746 [Trichonephila clavipes]
MITNLFIPELNNHDVQELWFQQDGATYHTARATIDLLKYTFCDRLISRFGPVNWPPRSCDFTPLDYFFVGLCKEFDIAHSVVSRLWKSFKTTGMCSRRHGEVVLEVRRLQKTDISSYQQKGTGAPQLSRRQVTGRNYPPTNKNTLIRALTEEWDKLPQQLLDNVVQSMVRRVECCITLPGGHIPY